MAMIWDAVLVSSLAGELRSLLGHARLRAHHFGWKERELTLYFRSGTLRWQLHPHRGWVTFSLPEEVPDSGRPLSAQVLDVFSAPDERILEVRLQRARGRRKIIRLVVELMTNQWNALLLEGEEGWIRHVLWTRRSEGRTLAVGQRYTPPGLSARMGIDHPLTLEEWARFIRGKSPDEGREALLDGVAFTSPINLPALLPTQTDRDPGGPLFEAGHKVWMSLRDPATYRPCLLEFSGDKQPYPFLLQGINSIQFPTLLSAIQAASEAAGGGVENGAGVRERLDAALHAARGRIKGIRKELKQAGDPEAPRAYANLLLARLSEVPRGVGSVTLRGFSDEEVTVTLDPALSPQENAQALYAEAARRERAIARLPPLLSRAEAALETLEDLKGGLMEGTVTPAEVAARIPGGARSAPGGPKQEERAPFRTFFTSGGLEVRVGRSSKDNDALTFRYSHPQDVWLHARDLGGAHVVLRWRKDDPPPQRDLGEAAILAALNSGARTSGTVPVDWTRRKYVRKPRKAPPGTVIPDRVQTLFVEPDPGLPERLRRKREEEEEV
jgi:hypothetical protein